MSAVRDLPSVDQLFNRLAYAGDLSADIVKNEIRLVLAERREQILKSGESLATDLDAVIKLRLDLLSTLTVRRVLNATGVILHTNLGRAPLPEIAWTSGYSDLEYDLATGKRGKRDGHFTPLLERLLGRRAIAVNNNAAAILLVLSEFATGQEVIVSRGELIEIGDGFRLPEIMQRSGALLREVGTTNRTNLDDYKSALSEKTGLVMRVHPSNFHISGFTARPSLQALTSLAATRQVPLYEDLGSGCIADLSPQGIQEPLVSESFRAGVNLVSFSGDKLLGGPQVGIIAGDDALIDRLRRNPLYRALRLDKLVIQALQTTLRHLLNQAWDKLPVHRMIRATLEEIHARAERVAAGCGHRCKVTRRDSLIGGGATPDQVLPSWVVEIQSDHVVQLDRRLRQATTPVIGRIDHDRLILDMRTISAEEEPLLISSLQSLLN
jgi:L-seryl-tRNA(Ser) seleniumtransferase